MNTRELKRLLAIVMTLVCMFAYVLFEPASVLAANARSDRLLTENIAAINGAWGNDYRTYSPLVGEMADERDEDVKRFRREDGAIELVSYSSPVHYMKDGEWAAIDNTLKYDEKTGRFVNTANDFIVELGADEPVLNVSYNGETLTIAGVELPGITDSELTAVVSEREKKDDLADEEKDDLLRFPEELSSALAYYTADGKEAGLEYKLSGKSLSEYITVSEKPEEAPVYVYAFTTSLIPFQEENVIFFKNSEGEDVMYFSAPVMRDADGSECFDFTVELIANEDNSYTYTLTPDEAWLMSEETVYPVVIDPDININYRNNVQDTYISSSHPTTNFDSYDRLKLGATSTYRSLLQLTTLPALKPGDVIIGAYINLFRYSTNINNSDGQEIDFYRIKKTWDETTATWNNFAPNSSSSVDLSRKENIALSIYGVNSVDITDLYKKWYKEPSTNHGVLFRLKSESTSGNPYYVEYISSRYSTSSENHPYFTVVYINSTGLESRFSYSSQSAGRAGSGSVNLFSGNLTFSFTDAEITNGVLPISVSHVYNTNDKAIDIGYGYGWRLNYSQEINEIEVTDRNGTKTFYEYIDGDGTRHYYKAKEGATETYVNELDKDSVLTINPGSRLMTITDKGDNKLVFKYGTSGNKRRGRLIRVEDANGNQTLITYDTDVVAANSKVNLHITSITEKLSGNSSNGQSITFSYSNSHLSSITVPNGLNRTYTYNNNEDLAQVGSTDSKTCCYYYSGHKLTQAKNIDDYSLYYAYDDIKRIVSVQETANTTSNNPLSGNSLTFEYGWNVTKVTDEPERDTIYQFNNAGQAVSVRDSEGNAVFAAYNTAEQTTTKLSAVSKMQHTVINLLKNSSFDSDSYEGWSVSGTGSTITSSKFHTGKMSLKLAAGGSAQQTVSVTSGKVYTFSAYFSGAPKAKLQIYNGTEFVAESDEVATYGTAGTDWSRGSVTFTAPSNSIYVRFVNAANAASPVYIDTAQLETGDTPNRVNLLYNADFSNGMTGWATSGSSSADGIVSDTSDSHPLYLSGNVYHMAGNVGGTKTVKQTLKVNGKKGDAYSFGAWLKSDSIPLHEEPYDEKEYGVKRIALEFRKDDHQVDFITVYFNADTTEWQFACGSAVAPNDYDTIILGVNFHRSANDCYYDGIQLYREEFSQGYEYDENGNLSNYTSLISQENDFQYDDDNNLTSAKDARGNTTTYTYDSHHNQLTATTPEGVVTTNVYDTNGNVTSTQVGNSTDYIKASTTYDTASVLAAAVTDARGNSVNYAYDSNTRLQTTVTDPKNNTSTYSYGEPDKMLRLASLTSPTGTGTDTAQVGYGYDTYGKLTSISRSTTVYSFTYDAWGNVVDTKVGNTTLSTNAYDEYGKLERVTYGNGFVTEYVYDELDRVSEIKQGTANNLVLNYKFIYNGEGDLYELRNYKTFRSTFFEYDHAGRCMASTEKEFEDTTDGIGYGDVLSGYRYEYDANNNLSKLICRMGDEEEPSWATTYVYDKDNRPTEVLLDNGKKVVNTYDAIGRITSKALKNGNSTILGTTVTYVPGANGSQTALVSTYKNGNDDAYSYTYDANGNITSIIKGSMSFTYEYDKANQLVRENLYYGSGNTNNATYTYTYDLWGNILQKNKYAYTTDTVGTVQDTVTYGYTDSQWGDKLTSYNGSTITYDSMGNPTSYLGKTLSWEGKQLKQVNMTVAGANVQLQYDYDENGLRMQKQYSVFGATNTTSYYYNGSVLIGMETEQGAIMRFSYDASGNVVSVDYSDDYGDTFTTYYYLRNAQGDIVKLIDNTGLTVVEYTYDSWGKPLGRTGTLSNSLGKYQPFRYRGYVYDEETGFYYLQSRYYDPTTCRFISADVLLSTGQGVVGHNSFAYCLNNPINRCDSNGAFSWGTLLTCVAIVAVAAVVVAATVATAGAAGAAVGAVAGAYFGATAASVTTAAVTAGGYVVAGSIAACAASDVIEECSNVNPIRDYAFNGNDAAYRTTEAVLYTAAFAYIEIGSMYQATGQDDLSDCMDTQCFVAGTLIKTEDGPKEIEKVESGDCVFATDPETGESGYKKVLQTFVKETYETVDVTYDGETITTTPTHPFYVPNKGWTNAIDLRAGDILVTCNGKYVVVEKVQHEILESPIKVYNFEVEDYHTYYVGGTRTEEHLCILVHNSCRSKNKLRSDPNASGEHTTFRYGEDGRISHYATFEPVKNKPGVIKMKLRFDGIGNAHNGISTPHFHIGSKVVPGYKMLEYLPKGYLYE